MLKGWTERSFESTVPSAAQPPARAAANNHLADQIHKRKTSLLWLGGYPMRGGRIGGGRTRTTMPTAWHEQQNCNSVLLLTHPHSRPGRSESPLLLLPFGEVSRCCALFTLGISFLGILSVAHRWAGVCPSS